MVGHVGIIKEMKARSKDLNFPEVMFLVGDSGTGKTTLAYIISAILNDPSPIIEDDGHLSPNPNSESSKAIRSGRFHRDVVLKDASRMSKDDVIELENFLGSTPLFDKNRVVIIDEAQELSKQGKGVTMTLLEKKRKNTYIILCTTEIDAFDKAVITRGQVYKFNKVSSNDISEYLFKIIQEEDPEEKIPIEFIEKGLHVLAENSDGSVRQAMQYLDRCLNGEFYSEEKIFEELGFVTEERKNFIVLDLIDRKDSALKEISKLQKSMKDFFYPTWRLLTNAALCSYTGEGGPIHQKLARNSNLMELLDVFVRVGNEPYFKFDVFLYEIFKYMSKERVPLMEVRSPVEQPPKRRPIK